MSERVPAPDGKITTEGCALTVLPEGTVLNMVYETSYLDAGGMGIVYKARKDGETFCIKEVESGQLQKVLALTQEKTMIERLDHPAIVKFVDFFNENDYLYLVLEFVEGQDLDSVIEKGSDNYIGEELIEQWASQLYDIFEYLHRQVPPVIYRDLKPKNIMCRPDKSLCLIDFGIARVHKELKNKDTYSSGTVLTASPEHYGNNQTDARSDIFTLGATLHYIAANGKGSGKGFFEFTPVRAINPALSENLEGVIQKALQLIPANRFQTIAEMRQAHLGKMKPGSTASRPGGKAAGTGTSTGKKAPGGAAFPWPVASAIIAAVAALSILVFSLDRHTLIPERAVVSTTASHSPAAHPASPVPGATPGASGSPGLPPFPGTGTPSPGVPGTELSFQGCLVAIPPGYSLNTENRDPHMREYRHTYTSSSNHRPNCRILQVMEYTLTAAPDSDRKKELLLRNIANGYQERFYKNEVTVTNEGRMHMSPGGARLNFYSFEAMSGDEEKAEHGIFAMHIVTVIIQGKKAFLLAAHVDTIDFHQYSHEFDGFFNSMIIKDTSIQAFRPGWHRDCRAAL